MRRQVGRGGDREGQGDQEGDVELAGEDAEHDGDGADADGRRERAARDLLLLGRLALAG